MAKRPERFDVRSRALRDTKLSHGAARLFLLLDDESWGEESIAIHQSRLQALIGIKDRALRTALNELKKRAYLESRRVVTGPNVYGFIRQKTAEPVRQKTAERSGRKLPDHPYAQETEEQETRPNLNGEENRPGVCQKCEGRGVVQKVFRGMGFNERCPVCAGRGSVAA